MRIAIVGSGGVGGYFGGRLAASGSDVTFVARGRHLDAMRSGGLRIESPMGDLTVQHTQVVETIAELPPVDLVIVAVKLWDIEQIAAAIRPLAEQGAAVVSFQNGVHKDDVLRKYLPAGSILGGVSYIASVISAPGVIKHSGNLQKLVFGEFDGTRSTRVQALFDACQKAGIDAEISDHIERLTWEKFVFLVGLSSVTSSTRQPIGKIRDNPESRALLHDVFAEVAAVARAKGVDLPNDYTEGRLTFSDTLPPGMIASMAHDLERGNRLELPWLGGWVSKLGAELGVPTPVNDVIGRVLALYVDGTNR
jgi:2-dehydropantoate 2-reductase